MNITSALQSPLSIHQSQLSFNLDNQQSSNVQFLTIESLVSNSQEISINHNLQNQNNIINLNSSKFVLNGKDSIIIELSNELINPIQKFDDDEFRLLIRTNHSNTLFTIPISTFFNSLSLDIEETSNSHIVNIFGIDTYDEAILRIYNTDTAELDEQLFSFDEEIILQLSPGTYWINVIVSSNNDFEFGGIEYTVTSENNLTSTTSDSSIWFYNIIPILAILVMMYYIRKLLL